MSEQIQFNINEQVEVVLNERGVEIMRKDHEALYKRVPHAAYREFIPPSTTEPTRFQLWCLMQTFGPHISLGWTPPFSTDITLIKP